MCPRAAIYVSGTTICVSCSSSSTFEQVLRTEPAAEERGCGVWAQGLWEAVAGFAGVHWGAEGKKKLRAAVCVDAAMCVSRTTVSVSSHYCLLLQVWAGGLNNYGQLGLGHANEV
jgi:hypothetical protein